MDDKIETLVDGFISKLLHLCFDRPRGWSDERTTLYIEDVKEEVLEAIRHRKCVETLSEMLKKARKRIVQTHKYRSWPSIAEIIDALEHAAKPNKSKGGEGRAGWPHCNSERMVENAVRWIEEKGTWYPYNGANDHDVAKEIVESGRWSLQELIEFGYQPQNYNPNPNGQADASE